MKFPRFETMGDKYPSQLENRYARILAKIDELWHKPEIHDYFSDLLIDKRGGRQGFPSEVLHDIIALREFRELETFREAERGEDALRQLKQRAIHMKRENFIKAIDDGDQELVDLFVRAKFDIRVSADDGTPPLVLALKKGYTVIAKILLNAGASINGHDKLGLTPLLVACGKTTQGYRTIALGLITKGALINVRDALGYTPLLLALSGNNFDIAQALIDAGADVGARTRRGENALSMVAAMEGPEAAAMAELLRKRGAQMPPAPDSAS